MKSTLIFSMFLALGLAAPATAATINSVHAINGGGGSAGCGTAPSQTINHSSSTETVSVNDGAINCTLYVEATAGGGLVGARGTLNGTGTSQAASFSSSSMTEIYLTPLFDVTDPRLPHNLNYQVPVTLNAEIHAVMSSVVDASGFISRRGAAGATVRGSVTFSGTSTPGNGASIFASFIDSASSLASNSVGADSAVLFQTLSPTLLVDWRFPLSAIFNLSADLSINGFGSPDQTASYDAFNTLSFSKTGPAFTVPVGFTVNAPELNIVNNRWIDPRVIPTSAVPLPAGMPLLLAGLMAFGLMRRRR